MTLRQITIIALALLLPLSLSAQKKKKRVVKKPVVEEPQEDPRITDMREMTQQIIIIDSIVADKKQFLSRLKLSSETGDGCHHEQRGRLREKQGRQHQRVRQRDGQQDLLQSGNQRSAATLHM